MGGTLDGEKADALGVLEDPPESVLTILQALLRFAHDHPDASAWNAVRVDHADELEALRTAVGEHLPDLFDTQFAGAEVAASINAGVAAVTLAGAVHPLVISAACARALDDRYDVELAAEWRRRVDGTTIEPGSIAMRPDSSHLQSLLGDHRVAVGQGRAAERCDATAHACLFLPDATVPPVEIRTDLEPYLQAILDGATAFASCHPNQAIEEWTKDFPLRASDGPGHRAATQQVANLAIAKGAAMVVFPELVGDPETTDLLRATLQPEQHTLIVAGSGHTTSGAQRVNRSAMWVATAQGPLPSVKPIVILKRVPYTGAFGNEGLTKLSESLSVFVSGPWRFVVGICRDVLDDAVRSALQQLGVNLVVAPAASMKTTNFYALAGAVATTPGFTLVSNGPRWWRDKDKNPVEVHGCIYGAPVDGPPPVIQDYVDSPGVCLAVLAEHRLETTSPN